MSRPKYRYEIRRWGVQLWLVLISWAGLAGLVILTDPEIFADYYYLPVWPLVWLSLWSFIWLVTKSGKRGVIYGTAGTLYLGLKYLGIGYWVYGVLLLGLAGVTDWYSSIKVKTI